MKNYLYILAVLTCATACSGDSSEGSSNPVDPVTGVKVQIETEIVTRSSVTAKKVYANGDEMNVWAKTYGATTADDIVKNIKAVFNGGTWTLTPDVYLEASKVKNAFIYASYPYAADNSNTANNINIDVTKQTDILYSGSYVPVTVNTYTAKLKMKHALSLATFNIVKDGYSGEGRLQKLTLYGDSIYTKGVMKVDKGKVSGLEKGEVSSVFDKTITTSGWEQDLPRMWVIPLPFNTKATKAYLKTVIDGKEYVSMVPEVEMKIGYQYVFHLVLTSNGLEFIPDQTTSIALEEEADQMQPLNGHGILKLTHEGIGSFSSLYLLGDNVFGTVKWGDESQETYTDGLSHEYATTSQHPIMYETWNSIGFELRNLKDVKIIDISQYE